MDLSQVEIRYPQKPFMFQNLRYDYKVLGYLEDTVVGHVTVSLVSKNSYHKDDFWFQKKGPGLWASRPVAFYKETEPEFRGQGISGRLMVLINEETKKRYGVPLASGSIFMRNPDHEWEAKGLAERPGKRVWEKLEEQGFAYRKDFEGKPRWIMKW